MELKTIEYSLWNLKPKLPSEQALFFKYRNEDVKECFLYWVIIF